MYTIIGGDGKEYGPVTAEQVRAWIAAGRASIETKAKALGTDEWKPLGSFPAFGGSGDEPPLITASAPALPANPAGRGARLGAAFIDGFLSLLSITPLIAAMVKAAMTREDYVLDPSDIMTIAGGMGMWMLGWVALIIVQVWMLSTRGQTIGKRLLHIRIVRLGDEGNPGFVRAFLLRSLLPAIIWSIPYLGTVFGLVDICFIFRADRRCLHDWVARTVVVNAAPADAAAPKAQAP